MHIEKVATGRERYRRRYRLCPNARSGFKDLLKTWCLESGDKVALPAYIGWSPREGSGVFDPVRETGVPYGFYRMDDRLRIDLNHLEHVLKKERPKLLVMIHYFGFVDPGYGDAVSLARKHGAYVLEDEAHALLTDLVGGLSGRLGDACIFSLHKILPVKNGGMLTVNSGHDSLLANAEREKGAFPVPWEYDLVEISRRRLENARTLSELLKPLAGLVDPLWGDPAEGEIPQTYPVIINGLSRDKLYFSMNEAGYGVVSLYHTLIEEISAHDFPHSHVLSKTILNLPVHQDVESATLKGMIDCLANKFR